MARIPRRSSGTADRAELLDEPLDGVRFVHDRMAHKRPLPVRTVECFETGVDGIERHQRTHRQMRNDAIRRRAGSAQAAASASANRRAGSSAG